jgi:hypothetical protein
MRLRATAKAGGIALLLLSAPFSAFAQPAGAEVALAEVLYQKGRQLMAEGKYAEACPKFAESYRLDAATGTLLNLASCHEGEHKLATAWLEYTEAVASAKRDHRDDRVKFAEEHLAAIEPKLSHLTVTADPGAEIPELKVQVDGVMLLGAARGVPAPIDPGEHVVEAQAPGRKPWSKRVRFGEEKQDITVTVPVLEVEVAAPAPAEQPASTTPLQLGPSNLESPARPIPTSVYIAGGVTGALAIGAGITGAVYMKDRKGGDTPAKQWGVANLAFIGAAVVGAGVTGYLYLTRPAKSSPATGVAIAPFISTSSAGVTLGGSL